MQDPLPAPRLKVEVDTSRGDFELFMEHCLPGLGYGQMFLAIKNCIFLVCP